MTVETADRAGDEPPLLTVLVERAAISRSVR
jgi:hypothetical protein